ncbi:hypothetical protein [Clostridium thermarum]|nr:hypothetical protein [Clostridium thermarum]
MIYVIISVILLGVIITLSLCKAAGRADQWEEEMNYEEGNKV